mgnify:CR=1 FL=1
MTPSERYVSSLCKKSFLPFWSYPSPLGKKGKELCDVLIICGNDIIIISVKDIKLSEHPDESVQYHRWYNKAIDSSLDQIYGAEKFLESVDEITLKDRVTKVKLPNKKERSVYRIAIAFGSQEKFPFSTGDFGKGFVHVFDEESTSIVISELDTFPDFINYLQSKEKFANGKRISLHKEVDFLALYKETSLDFDYAIDMLTIDEGLWDKYIKSEEYNEWKRDIQVSFIWDEIIDQLYILHIEKESNTSRREDLEIATRLINMECRNNRIVLGEALESAMVNNLRSRMIKLDIETDHVYVYLKIDSKNWTYKENELKLRCLVARGKVPHISKVIGIGIGVSPQGECIFDYAYLDISELSEEIINEIEKTKDELGFFKEPLVKQTSKN